MMRSLLHVIIPGALLYFALGHFPEAFAAKTKPAATTVEDPDAEDEVISEDAVEGRIEEVEEIEEEPEEEELLAEEESTNDTESMTKEIVEETDAPQPEFPYPGATEEGFEANTPKTMLEASGPPPNLIKPIRISASGEYFYGFKSSARDASASLRLGFFGPPDIINPENTNIFFETIYGESDIPTLFGDYQWSLTKDFGDIGIKAGTGLFVSQGQGKFATNRAERGDREPDEQFTFLMMPNTVTAAYRFQYHESQPVVPYIEGGGGYFTFLEIRDDGASPKFGGAAVAVAAGGVNILLDWLDPHSIRQLDSEWDINHVWLLAEYRMIQGLNKEYDFSSSVINAGVMMEF